MYELILQPDVYVHVNCGHNPWSLCIFPECSALLPALTPMILCCVGSPAALNLSAVSPFILPSILWEEDGLNQSTYVLSTGTQLAVCKLLIVSPQEYLLFTFALCLQSSHIQSRNPALIGNIPLEIWHCSGWVLHCLLFITIFCYVYSTHWDSFFSYRMSLVI